MFTHFSIEEFQQNVLDSMISSFNSLVDKADWNYAVLCTSSVRLYKTSLGNAFGYTQYDEQTDSIEFVTFDPQLGANSAQVLRKLTRTEVRNWL